MTNIYNIIDSLEKIAEYKKDDEDLNVILSSLYQEVSKIRTRQVLNRQNLIKMYGNDLRSLSYMSDSELDAKLLVGDGTFLDKYGMSHEQFRKIMRKIADMNVDILKCKVMYYESSSLGKKNEELYGKIARMQRYLNEAYETFILSYSDNMKINSSVDQYLKMYYYFKDKSEKNNDEVTNYSLFARFLNNEDDEPLKRAIAYLKENRDLLKYKDKIIPIKK